MKKISIYILLILPLISIAQKTFKDELGNIYSGNFIENDFNGKGTCTYSNGETYEGEWKDGVFSGKGTLSYPNGEKYEGNWSNGLQEGKGKYYYQNGEKYEGNWKEGNISGFGDLLKANNVIIYTGYWKNNLYDGEGKLFTAAVEIYEGQFRNGEFIKGKLTVSYNNGNKIIFDGDFKDGDIYNGKIFFPEGSIYSGKIANRTPSETGIYEIKFEDGKYVGELGSSLQDGNGKMTYKNGDVYEGEWRKGYKNGRGSMKYANGDYYWGSWGNDVRWEGELTKTNGDYFKGSFKDDDFYTGEIKTTLKDGSKYAGDYKEGAFTGNAKIEYTNGDRYEGLVLDSKRNGTGTLHLYNGNWIQGTWEADKKIKGRKRYKQSIELGANYFSVNYSGLPLSISNDEEHTQINHPINGTFNYGYLGRWFNVGIGVGYFQQNELFQLFDTSTSEITLHDYSNLYLAVNAGPTIALFKDHIILKLNYELGYLIGKKDQYDTSDLSDVIVDTKPVLAHNIQPEIMFRWGQIGIGAYYKISSFSDPNKEEPDEKISKYFGFPKQSTQIGFRLTALF
jgi:hypothetical protein